MPTAVPYSRRLGSCKSSLGFATRQQLIFPKNLSLLMEVRELELERAAFLEVQAKSEARCKKEAPVVVEAMLIVHSACKEERKAMMGRISQFEDRVLSADVLG